MYLKHAEDPRGWETRQYRDEEQHTSKNSTKTTDDSDSSNGLGTSTVVFIVVASVAALLLIAVVWVCYSRRKPRKAPLPGQPISKKGFLGRISGRLRGGTYEPAAGADDSDQSHQLGTRASRRSNADPTANRNSAATTNTAAVDRNTSVRSIMTLPAYRQSAGTNERVIGVEGERDGIDVIVDLPTQEEEEELRDQEMATLYQIRTTRRQLLAEREDRRTQRRDARSRGDRETLASLRAQTRRANEDTTLRDLRSEVERIKDSRNRSVSSVSYGNVGLAHHDGTRVRANSTESERVGLLSDAGSFSQGHQRVRSASSAASADSDMVSLTPTRSAADSQSGGLWVTNTNGTNGTNHELAETDLGDSAMPPPEYEDVSLYDDGRSTTPILEPPPDYPGPYRSGSQRSRRSVASTVRPEQRAEQAEERDEAEAEGELTPRPSRRGVGGIPQLPSLRIAHLPEIVIEPSSAHPTDHEGRDRLS